MSYGIGAHRRRKLWCWKCMSVLVRRCPYIPATEPVRQSIGASRGSGTPWSGICCAHAPRHCWHSSASQGSAREWALSCSRRRWARCVVSAESKRDAASRAGEPVDIRWDKALSTGWDSMNVEDKCAQGWRQSWHPAANTRISHATAENASSNRVMSRKCCSM